MKNGKLLNKIGKSICVLHLPENINIYINYLGYDTKI